MRTSGNCNLQKMCEEKLKAGYVRKQTSHKTNSNVRVQTNLCSIQGQTLPQESSKSEAHTKEQAKNKNLFPGLKKGTLRRLFRETRTEQDSALPLSKDENPPDTTPPNPNPPTPTNPLVE